MDNIINTGVETWKRAKEIIPGGSQLLSKCSEQFLPDLWPSYYSKAKGVEIWDLDNRKYIDMSLMGVGTCLFGYADNDIDQAVGEVIKLGNMTTLNCPEEVELAEILLDIDKWADMVRYARSGGEAMSVAIRIARAYSQKEKLVFCGYHGWHDWYLSANLSDDKNLDGHLLPGLKPLGVPRSLRDTSLPFNYNNIGELENLVSKHDIGTIVMESTRHFEPEPDFLNGVRRIADDIDAVLIFDEISSGWRMNLGGAYNRYNVFPDISVYGKAISNGYPMAAIVGRRNVMDKAQDSFISSTYWTDRIGPTAAISTINKLKKMNSYSHLFEIGKMIGDGWRELITKYGLNANIITEGLCSVVPTFVFKDEDNANSQELHTLYTQEMLDRGYLASKNVYVTYAHDSSHVSAYLENVDEVFQVIQKALDENNVNKLLKGPVAHTGFKRLT